MPDKRATAQQHSDDGFAEAREHLRLRRSLFHMLLSLPFALVICWGLKSLVPGRVLLDWLALKTLAVLLRIAIERWRLMPGHWRRGVRANHAAEAFDGLTWSALGFGVAAAARSDIDMETIAVVVGAGAVGNVVLSGSFASHAIFLGTLLLPTAAWQLARGGDIPLATGVCLLLLFVLLLRDGHTASRAAAELLRLRQRLDHLLDERSRALALAEERSAVKSRFLATMSHEMRTPLHGMLGNAQLLRGAVLPEGRERLATLERAGEHLLGLINDVLDLSRIEAGQLAVQRAPFDLAALLRDVTDLARPAAAAKGLALELDSRLPTPDWRLGDVARIRQVLLNLVGNATKFTEHGRVLLRARTTADGGVAFEVADTGIGIPAEQIARIFDAFHQLDSSLQRRHDGAGLGLAISRELVQAMGGDLACTSEPGRGTSFRFRLALTAVAALAGTDGVGGTGTGTGTGATDTHADATPAPRRPRVLHADDNPVNAAVATAMLASLGYDVCAVEDGAEALDRFRAAPPDARFDLVLLDWHMPVMDGLEATRHMRDHERHHGWPRVPIVAVTANAYESDREASLLAGMDAHLAKPFGLTELRALLEPLLERANSRARSRA
ncbi:ATP-binding protein [Derxia gummosa]|uniref:Virulence sensor protein BvgS n=1 Tax=Derxia gummosa DSM 723 TaxID=1121388 RepID=A0A8B6XA44_9BURK|nr:ATP-binding protein [Derxia gummosa]